MPKDDEALSASELEQSKQEVFATIDTLVSNFLYYDRKEDDDLPIGRIQRLVKEGVLTIDEMVDEFRDHLRDSIK
jgi:hypothetical protein